MNKITFSGRLAADAEVRYTPNGDPVLGFRVASDVGFGDRKTTNWFQCQVWGKRADSLNKMLTKGTPVTVFGTLTLREWADKDGMKRLSPDVRVDEVALHGKRDDSGVQNANQAPQTQQPAQPDEDPIPF